MTYPPQGPPAPGGRPDPSAHSPGDPSEWSQSGEVPPTEQIPRPDAATTAIPAPPVSAAPPPVSGDAPAAPHGDRPGSEAGKPRGRFGDLLRDPLSVTLVLIIVVALGLAGVIGGELFARNRADSVVAGVVQCVVQDSATASFGMLPPFLWQHATKRYSSISIQTAGNNVRDAKEMSLDIQIRDVALAETADAAGTIGSLVATVNWTAEGIKQTLQGVLPLVGSLISSVTPNPADGTITVDAGLSTIVAEPTVSDGGVSLRVLSLTGLGFTLPRETIQPILDSATDKLTKDYPMGIKADSVTVTKDGVQSVFSTRNASIPKANEDPCFAAL